MMKKLFKLFCFFLAANNTLAQDWAFKTELKPVTESGLHRVLLGAKIREHSQSGLGDLRLLDSLGLEVPYALVYESPRESSADFIELQMIKI